MKPFDFDDLKQDEPVIKEQEPEVIEKPKEPIQKIIKKKEPKQKQHEDEPTKIEEVCFCTFIYAMI